MYKKTVLDNGVRIVTESIENVKSIALGVCVLAGSRDENQDENGILHFIEHMLFKGTEKRTVKDIASEIEAVGAEANAFTAKEFTYYYARFLDEHLERIWDIIQDILQNSLFRKQDIEKEKGVVFEEIKDFEDSSADQSLYNLSQLLYKNHPLSMSILGSKENVKRFKRETIINFLESHYLGNNIIVAASGRLDHEKLRNLVKDSFRFTKKDNEKRSLPPPGEKSVIVKTRRERKQAHIALGTRTVKYDSQERYGLLVLDTLLGGGMSSRLFHRLREEEGLVYSVASFLDLFSDGGSIGVYLATSPKNVEKTISIAFEEMKKLKKDGLDGSELKNVKENLKGSLMLGLESTTNRMVRILKNEMHLKRYISLDETTEKIDKVTEDEVIALARKYLNRDKFCISVVGPIKKINV